MIYWEYKVVYTSDNLEKFLNKYGKEGWELVGFSVREIMNKLIFKRKRSE